MARIGGRNEGRADVGLHGGMLSASSSPTKSPVYNHLDVSFARPTKHERLSWPELFQGFETLRAITYPSSASFIRDLFGKLRQID